MEQNHMSQDPPPSYDHDVHHGEHDSPFLPPPPIPTPFLSAVPATSLPLRPEHDRALPPLAPLSDLRLQSANAETQYAWPSQNPLTAYYQPGPSQLSPKVGSPAPLGVATPDSAGRRGGSVVSIDDPDVRIAAEALGDLRADFISSPTKTRTASPPRALDQAQPEPLLSLFTTSHPLLGSALNNSLSAYSRTKIYSPRFKSSAEYVERVSRPVVNTVGSVGRLTGVEGGMRWFLGGRRPSHHHPADLEEQAEGSSKRRRVDTSGEQGHDEAILDAPDPYPVFRSDMQLQHRPRRSSHASSTVESLPAYDDYRSPNYEATVSAEDGALIPAEMTTPGGSSWQSRLVFSTSGLSIAMSEESLRSLKYCLSWLRWANEHIGRVISALKEALEELDSSTSPTITDGADRSGDDEKQLITRSEAERSRINARIESLRKDVLKTLKEVVNVVSKYAGGALPENARLLVRKHLTSLPQRFRLASASSSTQSGEGLGIENNGDKQHQDRQTSEVANRVLVLAQEGLDMMAQVSGVVDGTIVSAEEWCERLGKKKREESEAADNEAEVAAIDTPGEKTSLEVQDAEVQFQHIENVAGDESEMTTPQ